MSARPPAANDNAQRWLIVDLNSDDEDEVRADKKIFLNNGTGATLCANKGDKISLLTSVPTHSICYLGSKDMRALRTSPADPQGHWIFDFVTYTDTSGSPAM